VYNRFKYIFKILEKEKSTPGESVDFTRIVIIALFIISSFFTHKGSYLMCYGIHLLIGLVVIFISIKEASSDSQDKLTNYPKSIASPIGKEMIKLLMKISVILTVVYFLIGSFFTVKNVDLIISNQDILGLKISDSIEEKRSLTGIIFWFTIFITAMTLHAATYAIIKRYSANNSTK
jgi:hypothetical protein